MPKPWTVLGRIATVCTIAAFAFGILKWVRGMTNSWMVIVLFVDLVAFGYIYWFNIRPQREIE